MVSLSDIVGPIPDEPEVLAHGVDFRLKWWQPKLAEPSWAAHLGGLPAAERGRADQHVTRADLLNVRSSGVPLPGVLLTSFVWGTDQWAFLVGRRVRVFTHNSPSKISASMQSVLQLLAEDNALRAYESVLPGGANQLKHLSSSFATKAQYALDARESGAVGRALILDHLIAVALRAVAARLPTATPFASKSPRGPGR